MENAESKVPIEGLLLKWVDISVTVQNKAYSVIYELDKSIAFIKGFQLTTDRDALLYGRGSVKIEVNKQEVVPEGYEAKQLYSTPNVAVNERFFVRGGRVPVGNGQVKFEYTDTQDATLQFEPYRIRLIMDCVVKGY
jgi:hypothetical protein